MFLKAIVNEEPAYSYLCRAIDKGCHVITANKVMFSKYSIPLQERAKSRGVFIGYEATTAGGVPVIKTLKNLTSSKYCGENSRDFKWNI